MKQDREAIRTLAIQIGVRPAARQLGLNEDTVCSWAKRGNWFALPPSNAVQAMQAKPGDVMLSELQEHEHATRLSLALSARRMAKDAEDLPVRHAKLVQTVAQTMAIVHRQDENKGNVQFSLNVLNLSLFDQDKSDG